MSYDFWKKSLAGEKPKMFVDDPQSGFYRRAIKNRDANGNSKRTGWHPVAIFHDGEKLVGRVGSIDWHGDALNDLWSYVAGNPITEEEYRRVAESGLDWSDAPASDIPAANRDVAKTDNAPPEVPPEQAHAAAIDAAIGAALKTVTTEAEAAQALGSKNRIAELRLACDKAGRAIYEPMHAEYVKVRDPWQAPVKLATEAEKALNTAILTFREKERLRIAKEQAEAEQRQREIDEANARAADRAIARGEPEPEPEVIEMPIATAARIVATYGTRGVKEVLKKFAIIDDPIAAFTRFQNDPDLMERLQKLCTEAIRSGETVPGCSVREGLL